MKHALSATTLLLTLSVSVAAQTQDLDALIETCNGCHGDDGVSQWSDMPTIAGIDAFVHADALWVYREEGRPCTTVEFRQADSDRPPANMCEIAADLSEAQIDAVAEHYAALPFVPAQQDFDAALAQRGKAIHEQECARCHSDGGSNPADEASILAGQWRGYLEATFDAYMTGARGQPEKMEAKLSPLGSDDIQALIHYYASQQ